MTRLRTSGRPRGRHLIGRTLLSAALLAAVAAVPAAAVGPRGAPAATSARGVAAAHQQVAHFYGAYIDAVTAEDGGKLAASLRDFYLTPRLRAELGDWEAANHADGVLRAQNTPAGFRVAEGDSGAGHTWSTVRLTWGSATDPTYTYLKVRSDLETGKISGVRE
ncbi:hypothetical protein [Streptomyces sp. NBC_01013]|uniref:hypothetical protein n=1 Tax=Streptomyces sp. NBC_01013 TaxID=2903718 RepID=UPI003863BC31|nr:hypothetical protein OG538_23935 [Streptomyces sp. NBC_01013]